MTARITETRIEALLRALVREVVHPAIEKERAQQPAATGNQGSGAQGAGGQARPVAATKVSTPKTSSTKPQGYRVTDGSGTRKGRAVGHEGELTHVLWDDGTESDEAGTGLRDVKEQKHQRLRHGPRAEV
jgi:hypothetical protein